MWIASKDTEMNFLRPLLLSTAYIACALLHAETRPFPEPHNTQKITVPFLAAKKAISGMVLPEDLSLIHI